MEQAIEPKRLSYTKIWGLTLLSTLLLILSFPDFNLSLLAWVGFVPLLVAIAERPAAKRAFFPGWFAGSVFFYATCYWLTYSIIHYGGLSTWLAYVLLIPGALVLGLFPAIFAATQARLIRVWGLKALALAPFLWVALEWARLSVTGQLWNAIGYSQAFHPSLIQAARWGGVYAVGFVIVGVNAAIAFVILRRTIKAALVSVSILVFIGVGLVALEIYVGLNEPPWGSDEPRLIVIALQPNVPMDFGKSEQQLADLLNSHISESELALSQANAPARLVIWPESPMNFAYGTDPQLRERLAKFTQQHHVALLFNSQEVAPHDGVYNSALLVNEDGQLVAQYDKIRLMPFGEYVPLPAWLPGADRVGAIVGGFEPGTRYTLMVEGGTRIGTFICIESAYPWIARNFTAEGANVLVNISNDGYLGPTAVMRQHLANAVFRAVENDRPVLRVTNTGITASISSRGVVEDATGSFQSAVRVWYVYPPQYGQTFYTRHGDLFVGICSVVSLLMLALSLITRGK